MKQSRLTQTQINPAHFAAATKQESSAHLTDAQNAQTRPAHTSVPLIFGRYRLLEQRATGGFGEVYVCWDVRLQRRVAIKRLELRAPHSPATPLATIDEALAEARTASLLQHPNIVTVLDFETDGQSAYLVMEYIDGLSLEELLSRVEGGVLSYEESAHVIQSLGAALSYAHANGVLHLDIKPSNVLIDRNGQVKLSDFGMATLASAAGFGGARGGTIGYMSPEQLSGDMVDERSDIFSLAVVCYEMLSGRNPFIDSNVEGSLKRIEKGAKPLSKYEPDLGGAAENLISQACEANPLLRLASLEDFSGQLVHALGDVHEGAASLALLLEQLEDDEDYIEIVKRRQPHHAPAWLAPAIVRLSAALCLGWIVYQLAQMLGFVGYRDLLVIAGASALSAVWPPLGAILAPCACAAAPFLAQGSRLSLALAAAIVIVFFVWWIASGRKSHLASTAVLLTAATNQSLIAPALAARAQTPLAAFFTTIIAWLFALIFRVSTSSFLESQAIRDSLWTTLIRPSYIVAALGAGCAGAACSALSRFRGGTYVGGAQVVGAVILIFSQLIALRMENGGIWASPDWVELAVALVCFLLMGVAGKLFGPPKTIWKDDKQ